MIGRNLDGAMVKGRTHSFKSRTFLRPPLTPQLGNYTSGEQGAGW